MSRWHELSGGFRAQRFPLLVGLFALIFCAAPTPGDIGGCGQKPAELDSDTFFASKEAIDCQNCEQCGIATQACNIACNDPDHYPHTFPDQCLPLVHDGEVCLRVLLHTSCSVYGTYMADHAPQVPTECNFCPEPRP